MTDDPEDTQTHIVKLQLDWEANAGYMELTSSTEPRLRQVVLELDGLGFEIVLDISDRGGLFGIEIIGIDAAFEGGDLLPKGPETPDGSTSS